MNILKVCCVGVGILCAEIQYPIIPAPKELIQSEGTFSITPATQIICKQKVQEVTQVAASIAAYFGAAFGKPVTFSTEITQENGNIVIDMPQQDHLPAKGHVDDEAYQLVIAPDAIRITAYAPVGVLYAFQTLRQLLPATAEMHVPLVRERFEVPCLTIIDAPRFSYRGIMLDVARHMMPLWWIKKLVDCMAQYKFNRLHLHLTDDQGWRIEIKKYPQLQNVAAYRAQTQVGRSYARPIVFDGVPYGGYYTQEEIKDLVTYARERYITIIPEIEFPGHCVAALAAYPELGCTKRDYAVAQRWGTNQDVYCAGSEKVFDFMRDVLEEVVALFPSPYIHIGGDEVQKERWQQCAACTARIVHEQLQDEHALQSYCIKRIETIVNDLGRSLIGWDEILEGCLAPNATVMSWLGTAGGIKAAQLGHTAIMTPHEYVYFDYYQSKQNDQPLAMGRYLPLEKVYSYEPIPEGLTPQESARISGVQGNLWTEYIRSPHHAEYMLFPRTLALAEVAWSQKNTKNYADFLQRLQHACRRLKAQGINFCESLFAVIR